ncbi:MAG TPA: hypothetical protein VGL56_11560 [Fimbriimonadaceae bacterium]
MFENDEFKEVFSEGYREPGDEVVRLSFYVLLAAALCGSAAAVFLELYSFVTTRHGLNGKSLGLDIAITLLCLLLSAFVGLFFVKEAKYWDLKRLSADKVVAGGFMLGMAVVYLGFRLGGGPRYEGRGDLAERAVFGFGGVGVGIAICLLSLAVGLFFAFAEKFEERPKRINQLMIDRRYGLDANLMEHENHPCPWEDEMQAVVICRTLDGKRLKFFAGESAYDLADPGKIGAAVTRGWKLQEFHPKR